MHETVNTIFESTRKPHLNLARISAIYNHSLTSSQV